MKITKLLKKEIYYNKMNIVCFDNVNNDIMSVFLFKKIDINK